MPDLTVSIVINTCDRAADLQRLLASLAHLEGGAFEVVVVNGPSTDDTEGVLQAYAGRIKTAGCARRNLCESRNAGIRAAGGDIVVFIDDDAIPADARWLERFREAFAASGAGRTGAVGGAVLHRDTDRHEFLRGWTSDYGLQSFQGDPSGCAPAGRQTWYPCVPGGNAAFRRSALAGIGGFDEFYAYYFDETDVCVRLIRGGWEVRRLDDNAIRHYPHRAAGDGSRVFDRAWDVIARSDTYFALRHGRDSLPLRLVKTLAAAPRKHFVREIMRAGLDRRISAGLWARCMMRWLRGVAAGAAAGLARQPALVSFGPPPPFLPFRAAAPRRLCIGLLSQAIPGQRTCGGIGRYTHDLARGLHERGHRVHLFCRDEQPYRQENLGFAVHGIGSADLAFEGGDPARPILRKNLAYSAAVARRVQEADLDGAGFDVIHASNWDAEPLGLIRAGRYPTVLMLVTPLAQVIQAEQWELNDDLRACVGLDGWQIRHADAVCTPSNGVWTSYEQLMGIRPDTVPRRHVVPLGIVPDPAGPTAGSGPRRRLLFVGRCERRKGVDILLEVLPDLLERFPDWECELVGDDRQALPEGGTMREQFLSQHGPAGWLSRVVFRGVVDEAELRAAYRACDLFVAPSRFESFGLIYHEAMQYGKAVVGCRTGGVPEVVRDGVDGVLVAPGSSGELRDALARLMADDALRRRMGEAAARRIRNEVNYRRMAELMEAVYLGTVSAAGGARSAARDLERPRPLSLQADGGPITWTGPWATRDQPGGGACQVGGVGASARLSARAGTVLRLVVWCDGAGGLLEVRAGGAVVAYVDSWAAGGPGDRARWVALPPGPGPLEVVLTVHSERNPESVGSEVRIRGLSAAPAGAGARAGTSPLGPLGTLFATL